MKPHGESRPWHWMPLLCRREPFDGPHCMVLMAPAAPFFCDVNIRNYLYDEKPGNTMLNFRLPNLLRWASLTEGVTLILLVCLAVPLKRMAGMPEFVTMMGPLHGAAFLAYVAVVMRASSAGLISVAETARLMWVAFIPFGAFFVAGMLKRKAASPTKSMYSNQ